MEARDEIVPRAPIREPTPCAWVSAYYRYIVVMLLAYIDEIGEPGAFISRNHSKFNTSPAFGYAGLILPENRARSFGAEFQARKRELFRNEINQAEHPGRWERKGASIFRPTTPQVYPHQVRVFDGLVQSIAHLGGRLFYYANEKPQGTPKQTGLDVSARETSAMQETLNRIARHADNCDENVLVMIDQINEKTRAERLPRMYSHILGRTSDYREIAANCRASYAHRQSAQCQYPVR